VAGEGSSFGHMITKTIRLSGNSSTSFEDAIGAVLARAALTIDAIESYQVVELGGTVDRSGAPATFRVVLDVTFVVKESVHG
jgi:flavin-binding protein dodecin